MVDAIAAEIETISPGSDQCKYEARKLFRAIVVMQNMAVILHNEAVQAKANARAGMEADLAVYDQGFVKVNADGSREHVPLGEVYPPIEGAQAEGLIPPIEGDGVALMATQHPENGGSVPDELNPEALETVPAPEEIAAAHEAQEAARRAEQEAAIAAQLADPSPLDAVPTGKGSKKGKVSKIDGQATLGEVSPLDAPKE